VTQCASLASFCDSRTGLERCGDSVARELMRVADASREAAERAAASVATLVATAEKASGHGLSGGEGFISSYFLKV
jgi:hypothetical protein